LKEASGRFEIKNRLGMHARAAAEFVQLANRYEAEIRVRKGGIEANGKSIMSVLTLAALQGETVEVAASGVDCQEALKALGSLIEGLFGEEE
jgi:phosphocarrier protein HPr